LVVGGGYGKGVAAVAEFDGLGVLELEGSAHQVVGEVDLEAGDLEKGAIAHGYGHTLLAEDLFVGLDMFDELHVVAQAMAAACEDVQAEVAVTLATLVLHAMDFSGGAGGEVDHLKRAIGWLHCEDLILP
jgi:hypothetical protein